MDGEAGEVEGEEDRGGEGRSLLGVDGEVEVCSVLGRLMDTRPSLSLLRLRLPRDNSNNSRVRHLRLRPLPRWERGDRELLM